MDKHTAHVFRDDLEKLQNSECAVTVYSVEMRDPDRGETIPLVVADQPPPAPVAEELSSEPAGKVRDDAMMHNQAMVEFYPGKRPRIGEPVYTHPQPAVPEGWKLQLIRAYTDGYGAGHEATVEGGYVHIYQCDRDEYFAEHMEDWIKDNAAAPPAVPDVDALAEFIRDIDDGEYILYHEFAQRICNWIEEQQK